MPKISRTPSSRDARARPPKTRISAATLTLLLSVAVAVLVAIVYLPAFAFEFVNYDDVEYVTKNPHVVEGLSLDRVAWSLTAFVNGNWHPVTMLSHQLDVSLFGLRPAGHHVTSVLLHAACAAAIVWLGFRATGRVWPSVAAAAIFGVHPLNVESVAWIAERKNPLSTLFWLLALLAWVSYRRAPLRARGRGPGDSFYWLAFLGAALALASKPMAVTLPFTLMVLDFWPLADARRARAPTGRQRAMELAPFFVLSFASGILTLLAQDESKALQSLSAYPLSVRLLAVPVGYAWYLVELVWPTDLAVFYPHPNLTGSLHVSMGAATLIAGLSAGAWLLRRRAPWAAAGWAWYLITLAPVAGFVQVGSQAYADRYAYVPLIGILWALAWSAFPALGSRPRRFVAVGAMGAAIVALALVTRAQLAHWKDSVALFEHARNVVPDSSIAWNNLGMAYVERDRVAESVDCFRRAVQYAPRDTDARSNLGSALTVLHRSDEAVAEFEKAMEQAPGDASIRFNLATALDDLRRTAEAEQRLKEALQIDPAYAKAPLFLGILYIRQHRLEEALPLLENAVALEARNVHARLELGAARALQGNRKEAVRQFETALRLDPGNLRAQDALRRLR